MIIRSFSMSRAARLKIALVALLAAAAVPLLMPGAAQAASLTQVTGFGSNPGNLSMYVYRPDGLAAGAPLVVAMHGCTQDATAYYTNSGWKKYADLWGFALVFPQQKSANAANACFNWFTAGDVERGQGEALSIKQMVDYALSSYGLNPARVYVTGLSAGGGMTAVMLATYPDVFAAGSVVAGLPYGCAPATSPYTCMSPGVDKTPAQWGDLVRAAYSGYAGPWPRVSIWHGTSDTVVVPANATELRDQWTNVWRISTTPTSTATLPGTSVENYDSNGQTVVRVYRVSGMGHGTPVHPGSATDQCGTAGAYFLDTICSAYRDALFFGLGGSPTPTPTPTASPTASPTVSPTVSPTPTGPCFTASNYAQVSAGRAHQSAGQTYANGSNQAMGLWNTYVTHTLRQTGTNYYVLADGQC
jgi:poly(hydroxyalkanoate) depolymerase family esterase